MAALSNFTKKFCGEAQPISHKGRRRTIAALHGKKAVCPLQTQKRTVIPAAVKSWESLIDPF
jgi:hypothetical protein